MPKLPTHWPGPPPRDATALMGRAAEAEQAGRPDMAIPLYQQVLTADPFQVEALNRLAGLSSAAGDLTTARRCFETSLQLLPGQPAVWVGHGSCLARLGLLDEALPSFEQAIRLAPRMGNAHALRAVTLARLGRYQEARPAIEATVRLLPRNPTVAAEQGVILRWLGDTDGAFAAFDRALSLDPTNADAQIFKAFLLLTLGDLPAGFRLYEHRWDLAQARAAEARRQRPFPHPPWLGETSLSGKTLLIHTEQGFGDNIQFCRYARLAAEAGARVVVEADAELTSLLRTAPGVSDVITSGQDRPAYDHHIPMMSLPLAFGTTMASIPADIPYLSANPDLTAAWRARLAAMPGLRVGLIWAGGTRIGDADAASHARAKSVPLSAFAPLATIEGCSFISIQVGPAAAEAATPPAGLTLHDPTAALRDFADTAALMANLDLVISVCTATVHLAGALGRPVWLLNRFDTDWRWFLDRTDSPWYPTMRIFRQPRMGDWGTAIGAVTEALRSLASRPAAQ